MIFLFLLTKTLGLVDMLYSFQRSSLHKCDMIISCAYKIVQPPNKMFSCRVLGCSWRGSLVLQQVHLYQCKLYQLPLPVLFSNSINQILAHAMSTLVQSKMHVKDLNKIQRIVFMYLMHCYEHFAGSVSTAFKGLFLKHFLKHYYLC